MPGADGGSCTRLPQTWQYTGCRVEWSFFSDGLAWLPTAADAELHIKAVGRLDVVPSERHGQQYQA